MCFLITHFLGKIVKMLTALFYQDGILCVSETIFYLREAAKLSYDETVAIATTHFPSTSRMNNGLKPGST